MEHGNTVNGKPEWIERKDNGTLCTLCPRRCVWSSSKPLGDCRVRGLVDAEPSLPGYGMCVSLAIDPIEKKPLYHFLPGSRILSTGPGGCNLTCDFCQNWSISQSESVPARYVEPGELADLAFKDGSSGIAYTYTEPTIWFEYIRDTAPLIRKRGGAIVMVSNGYVNPAPLEQYLLFVDAWNVDLKSWSSDFYREHCDGERDVVLRTIKTISSSDSHLEITFLVIPGCNDDPEEWREMASWIRDTCGPDTPLHISRYFPRYKLGAEQTPLSTIRDAKGLFSEYLNFVYPGNVHEDGSTYCPGCGTKAVERDGYMINMSCTSDGCCESCGAALGIICETRN